MLRRVLALAATAALAAGVAPVVAGGVSCPVFEPAPLAFAEPRFIDTQRAGGEPVSVVAQDGSIIVSAHAGTTHLYKDPTAAPGAGDYAVGYFNQTLNWRSADGGQTWTYTGAAGAPAGPHSPTSTGFSDPDLTIDASGRLYNVEIDLANVSVFSSLDDGQTWPIANALSSAGDRPWIVGQDADEVFLWINALIDRQVWRSTDGGVTWLLRGENSPTYGKLWNDPTEVPDANGERHTVIGPIGDGFAISTDDGATWREHWGASLGPTTAFFGTVAVDNAGWIYTASAGGYDGARDESPDGQVWFNSFDRSTGRWGSAVKIPTPPGDALWPWVDAGDDGRAVVVWYQSLAGQPDEFYIYAAYTTNAHGTPVTCSDGSQRTLPPVFSVANASGRPIHRGEICLSGTTCNANINQRNADRRLGDFFTVNHDLDGRIFIVSGDTTLPNPLGGPKPVGNPIFIAQTGGEPLLAAPVAPRPTRCIFPLPQDAPDPACHPWG